MQQRKINRSGQSVNYILPSPIGGLNARDSLDLMPETDAIVMDNYLPLDTKVALRKGYSRYVLAEKKIETLVEYTSPGKNHLFAFGMGTVFDISSKVGVKDYEKDFSENNWQACQFKNYLILVNGTDTPQTFYIADGKEHFEDLNFSGDGLNAKRLINVCVSKQRLFFVEKGSLNFWYSEGVGEVQGTLKKFDLSTIARDGGELVACACWTQDGGQGIDDLTVFITSRGEVMVYQGTDPSSANGWALKGTFRMSAPLGYRCILPYQGDLIIISEDGYVPLSKALPLNKANASQIAFSDKIRGLFLNRAQANHKKQGWQGILYSRGGYAIFNVPVSQQFEQHVINTNTGAWCRFTNIPALCWGLFQGRLYFGSKDGVFLFDDGYSDAGVHIKGKIAQAYSNLGSNNLKKIQMLNPRTKSSTKYALVVYANVDFDDKERDYVENIGYSGLTKWQESKWSSLSNQIGTKWATLKGKIRSQWIGSSATGFKISLVFQTKTRGNLIEWYDTGFRYEQGRGIL